MPRIIRGLSTYGTSSSSRIFWTVPSSPNLPGSAINAISILFVFIIIIIRLFYIQVIKGNHYFQIAEENREKKIPIIAERGQIFDRNGIQLTQNIPNFSLVIMPHQLPRDKEKIDLIIERLSQITNRPKEEIRQVIEDFASYRYESIVISEDLNYETALLVQIAAADLPGINIQHGSKRLYLNGIFLNQENNTEKFERTSISHVLGYESKINKEELDILRKIIKEKIYNINEMMNNDDQY